MLLELLDGGSEYHCALGVSCCQLCDVFSFHLGCQSESHVFCLSFQLLCEEWLRQLFVRLPALYMNLPELGM